MNKVLWYKTNRSAQTAEEWIGEDVRWTRIGAESYEDGEVYGARGYIWSSKDNRLIFILAATEEEKEEIRKKIKEKERQ